MKSERILIVDPDEKKVREICGRLEKSGYECITATNAAEGIHLFSSAGPNLVIAENELPDQNGYDLCREVIRLSKKRHVPFVFYTNKDSEIDLVVGFEVGADDYVSKKVGTLELSLRVEAILKRKRPYGVERSFVIGNVIIDSEQRIVTFKDQTVPLSPTEFQILFVLARMKGSAMQRKDIVSQAWPNKIGVMRRTVDAHIKSIRAKLVGTGVQILTVRGFGYSLVAEQTVLNRNFGGFQVSNQTLP